MPWTPASGPARHTHKAKTKNQKKMWSDIANSVLSKTGDEARAVRTANGVLKRRKAKGK